MTLGLAPRQGDLLDDLVRFCSESLPESSIYTLLHRERDHLFPDEFFADLFCDRGRRCVPPSVVAVVMVLQRMEGLSDREAVERYMYDTRWRYAAGVGGYEGEGRRSFVHTVLVDMRERLRRSERRDRIFEVTLDAAKAAGLIGRKRVLDSTALYDAVATMDTITLIRSALRRLLLVASSELEAELRAALRAGDAYESSAKPQIDWDDSAAREELIDSRAKDGFACISLLDGRELGPEVTEAARLLAAVVGQDLEAGDDGVFRIARRVAPDRIISTVDPEARHGHKTAARGFDGFKGHIAIDPDSEIITATVVSPGNTADGAVAPDLLKDDLDDDTPEKPSAKPEGLHDDAQAHEPDGPRPHHPATPTPEDDLDDEDEDAPPSDDENDQCGATATPKNRSTPRHGSTRRASRKRRAKKLHPLPRLRRRQRSTVQERSETTTEPTADEPAARADRSDATTSQSLRVYGDAAYGTAALLEFLERSGAEPLVKVQSPVSVGGRFSKDRFAIDLERDTVTCPADVEVVIRRGGGGEGLAAFGSACGDCTLRSSCTDAKKGRVITVNALEAVLARGRERQGDAVFAADYRATRPKVERKLGHLMRRRHGGRRARVRGRARVDQDFSILGAAANLARMAVLGARHVMGHGWEVASA